MKSNTDEKTRTAIYNSESEIESALTGCAFECLRFLTSLLTLPSLLRLINTTP